MWRTRISKEIASDCIDLRFHSRTTRMTAHVRRGSSRFGGADKLFLLVLTAGLYFRIFYDHSSFTNE